MYVSNSMNNLTFRNLSCKYTYTKWDVYGICFFEYGKNLCVHLVLVNCYFISKKNTKLTLRILIRYIHTEIHIELGILPIFFKNNFQSLLFHSHLLLLEASF